MCENCKFWNDPNHPEEMFRFLWGMYWYNVPQGYKLMEGRDGVLIPTENLKCLIEWPPRPDGFDPMKRQPLVEHLDHVDMDKPVLFACYPETMSGAENLTKSRLLIDGTHRVARAIRDGHPTVKAYMLTQEESNQILIDNSGRAKKKPKPKPKKPAKPRKPRKTCKSTEDSSTD